MTKYVDINILIVILITLSCCSQTKQDHVYSDIKYHYIYICQDIDWDITVAEYKTYVKTDLIKRHKGKDYEIVSSTTSWWEGMPLNEIIIIVQLKEKEFL
jgi:hypothetical protein